MKVKLKYLPNCLVDAETHEPLPLNRGTVGSAGIDVRAVIPEGSITLQPNTPPLLIETGIAIHIEDPEVCAMLLPRSGIGHKNGIVLGNTVGLIDSDYQGEIKVSLMNRGAVPQTVHNGDRIAQLLFLPIIPVVFETVEDFNEDTERNERGFNSTGTI
ncbi:MAG: dUTPase [Podoviridae sp. ctLUJ1]|nr:MAG: dUTPase [Podoviridae sp. ctLUJ1]